MLSHSDIDPANLSGENIPDWARSATLAKIMANVSYIAAVLS
jgi:hypothetical protein